MNIATPLISALVALVLGGAIGYLLRSTVIGKRLSAAREAASKIVEEAEEKQKQALLEAKEEALKIRQAAEGEARERRQELARTERRLSHKEETLERRLEGLDRKEKTLVAKERDLDTLRQEVEGLKEKEREQLSAIAGLSMEQARELVLKEAEVQMQHEISRRYFELEQKAKVDIEAKARNALILSIQRLATDVAQENTVTVVPIPNDEMKGRLIGREGRNIRALEQATGVDLIIDDTPEAVTLSSFDPVRREVARVALTKLILDGRIHPARVEETVEKARQEVEANVIQEGEQATFATGVRGLHPELVRLLGTLRYRTSYGHNVLTHSIEVSLLSALLASQIGCNVEVAKAAGLLHDIGKALTHEVEGPHAEIGGEVARKYGIPDAVRRAVEEHHLDDAVSCEEAFIVAAADAISGARPGARKDTLEHYVRRLEALEAVAREFPGVEKSFAIQAGREVRVMVKPEQVDDVEAARIAREMAKRIQDTLVYPGQIKITVIRETRSVEYAR